jgi:hypothetical protein
MTVWIPFDKGICTDHQGDIWVQHFWVAVSMVFFMAATMFTLLKLSGNVGALGWWDLFINFGWVNGFFFLVSL